MDTISKLSTSIAHQSVPPVLLPLVKALVKPFRPIETRVIELQETFLSLNMNLPASELILRKDLCLTIHPASRDPFEAFCLRMPEMVEEMDAFLKATGGKARLLDVGALHGIFSLVFAAKGGRALAVDPSPLAFSKLLYNVHKNNFTGQVIPAECALSDAGGSMNMYYEWEHAVAAPLDSVAKIPFG